MKSTGNVSIVRMVDSSFNKLAECSFLITEKGIEDIPDDVEVAKRLLESAAKYEQKMTQEELKKKEKKDNKEGETEVKELTKELGADVQEEQSE
jgi:hypothetical protein